MKKIFGLVIVIIGLNLLWYSCDNSTEPKKLTGNFTGVVEGIQSGSSVPVDHAYIIAGDNLLAITDENGAFDISAIEEGTYHFICSALFYADTVKELMIEADKTLEYNFSLVPDSATGKVYGEFQDEILWNQMLNEKPYLANWDADSVWAGVTGATLQTKTLGYEIPPRTIRLGDSLLAYTDGFGQYWFRIQGGTYPITGSCDGYQSVTKVVKAIPDQKVYLNFILPRE